MKGVNGLDYLFSPDRVKFLVNKFDERTLYDWEHFRSKSDGTTYERFVKFLLHRYEWGRSVIARQKSMILSSDDEDSHSCSHSVAATNITCTGCRRGSHVIRFTLAQVVDAEHQWGNVYTTV